MIIIRNKDVKSIELRTRIKFPIDASVAPSEYYLLIASTYNFIGINYNIKFFESKDEAKEFLEHILNNLTDFGWLMCDSIEGE